MKVIVAVTGASGTLYAEGFLKAAKEHSIETHLIITEAGTKVSKHELGGTDGLVKLADAVYDQDDLLAGIASGSHNVDAMVIVPCTMKSISAVAHGFADNLVTRAADVQLKEGRPLILVPRETPVHAIHLENMAKLAHMGAVILPAMPGFYHDPKSIQDLVDFITGKILDQLGKKNNLYRRWGSD
ncbi:UbiX family flavin prenyltransferase [Candidatus Bathyarchaeota archaeon]|jgi:flavin prenyltransferase|nr:UbiX family flavin prenyltransferase [Candidatus Bathyarchaeota archaeon]MBT4320672.1 UbiX family flavin prenyltransferase [Candidatus Bathyarchaeota archaeon]MBT4423726.1 UbiX family flavin prenyltransferase [Candidatus Bathyarchaeota archaeon]MBT6604684.1 UbiX family flavin prenyltransferase [Candidatus Bathyarchaeota archaeon]MBT7186869.1 UbiX family flavin prenyltransferase [Candidatus Bathyarchaeota archaeon]